ncbi:MAG: sigma-70 family RNA polymerase sigma factor [Rikenellaceae bacterium]|nr:sigma-70 family RNA polymerase sigma factor [Rikenellaceae bacterium]MCL2691927.1 sigma-70 family RNA polymerase sigma factor [Rikenellaceae bacterium]
MGKNNVIDALTLRKLRDGDHDAFEQVYLNFFKPIRLFLSKLTGSSEEATELTQMIFARVWERRVQIDPDKNIKQYLYTIARNSALRHIYEKRRFHEKTVEDMYDRLHTSENPIARLEEQEVKTLVQAAIERMPEIRSRVFQLYFDGLSNEEIAREMGITTDNAAQHLSRARKNIKNRLLS